MNPSEEKDPKCSAEKCSDNEILSTVKIVNVQVMSRTRIIVVSAELSYRNRLRPIDAGLTALKKPLFQVGCLRFLAVFLAFLSFLSWLSGRSFSQCMSSILPCLSSASAVQDSTQSPVL